MAANIYALANARGSPRKHLVVKAAQAPQDEEARMPRARQLSMPIPIRQGSAQNETFEHYQAIASRARTRSERGPSLGASPPGSPPPRDAAASPSPRRPATAAEGGFVLMPCARCGSSKVGASCVKECQLSEELERGFGGYRSPRRGGGGAASRPERGARLRSGPGDAGSAPRTRPRVRENAAEDARMMRSRQRMEEEEEPQSEQRGRRRGERRDEGPRWSAKDAGALEERRWRGGGDACQTRQRKGFFVVPGAAPPPGAARRCGEACDMPRSQSSESIASEASENSEAE